MPKLAEIVAAKASTVDPYWDGGTTRRWPKSAIAAIERGMRERTRNNSDSRSASKAEKRSRINAQRNQTLGING